MKKEAILTFIKSLEFLLVLIFLIIGALTKLISDDYALFGGVVYLFINIAGVASKKYIK